MARGGKKKNKNKPKTKTTSAEVAKQASKALQDGRSSARTKSIAGSALAQAEGKKGKGKKGKGKKGKGK